MNSGSNSGRDGSSYFLQGNSADAQGEVPGQVRRVQLEPVKPAGLPQPQGGCREFGLQLAPGLATRGWLSPSVCTHLDLSYGDRGVAQF